MASILITPKFNKKNSLEIIIHNNSTEDLEQIKLCFNLIYSIKSINGANIYKKDWKIL